MKETFDPYHKWLGIPSQDQPPHHYRLLGIELFEADADVIANAADARMAQVKTFQTGSHSATSQRILNEIATAKVCLLNAGKRREYDRRLRLRLETAAGAPPAVEGGGDNQGAEFDYSSIVSSASSPGRTAIRKRKTPAWIIPAAFGGAAVVLCGIVALILQPGDNSNLAERSSRSPAQIGQRPDKTDQQQGEKGGPARTMPGKSLERTADVKAKEPSAEPRRKDSSQSAAGDQQAARLVPKIVSPVERPPDKAQPSESKVAIEPPPKPAETPKPREVEKKPKTVPEVKKTPVPDDAARRAAEKRVSDVFRDDLSAAKTPGARLALASKLASQASSSGDDPAIRYVLLTMAIDLVVAAGETEKAFQCIDRLGESYAISPLAMKADLVDGQVKALQPGPQGAGDAARIMDDAARLIEASIAEDDYDIGLRLARTALVAARKTKDAELIRTASAHGREVERLKAKFIGIQKALETLADAPDDPATNLLAGKWYCLSKGDWTRGLPLLAKGSDEKLAELAKQDLTAPTEPKQQVATADAWWDLAEKQPATMKSPFRFRAEHWYEQASAKLTGLDKTRVEKRLEMIGQGQSDGEIVSPHLRGKVKRGNVALASNGTTVSGNATNPTAMIDGDAYRGADKYTETELLTHSKWPCDWVITFNRTYQLQLIRFRLWDGENRSYRYALAISSDGRKFIPLPERPQGEGRGWQEVRFRPRAVKAVRLIGLHSSANTVFHVIEFEAYCTTDAPPVPVQAAN